MLTEKSIVNSNIRIKENTFLLEVNAPEIASTSHAGQFCNIKVSENDFPLLRRPFSICDVINDSVYFMYDIHGEGTKILSAKKKNDEIDILGPLGNGFNVAGNYKTAIIVGGGIGVAPFPYLIKKLKEKTILTFVGARNSDLLITEKFENVFIATDDGSAGFKGNVVELLKNEIINKKLVDFKIFGCGPNAMLKSLQEFSTKNNFNCQISVESAMACGFGICQGCPIETADGESYKLICKDGPVFDSKDVKL